MPDRESRRARELLSGDVTWNTGTAFALANGGIEGFATASSVNRGSSFGLKLQTSSATTASIEIYRGGWYGGTGARLISVVRGVAVGPQPACTSDTPTGLYRCSNWSTSATITTSATWPSGVYLLRLVRDDNGLDYEFPVVVRDDASHSALLYGLPFTTYQAYNNYGGKSLYGYNSTGAETVSNSLRAVKVSFDRPYVQPRDTSIPNWYGRADYPFISWLERSGYDVTYAGSDDLDANAALAANHSAYISGAHDEYWSSAMRTAVQSARDAHVGLFLAGANASFWRIRFEDGRRTEVCYKTTEGVPPTRCRRPRCGATRTARTCRRTRSSGRCTRETRTAATTRSWSPRFRGRTGSGAIPDSTRPPTASRPRSGRSSSAGSGTSGPRTGSSPRASRRSRPRR